MAGNPEVAVENFFMLLDDFFTFKSKSLAKDIEIHVRPHKSAYASDSASPAKKATTTKAPAASSLVPICFAVDDNVSLKPFSFVRS